MEASWSGLGDLLERSCRPLGALLDGSRSGKKCSGMALGCSKRNSKRVFSHLEGQKAPKTEPGSVPNRVSEATRAEKNEFTKLSGPFTKFFDLRSPGYTFGTKAGSKRGPNRSIDAEGAGKAS